MTPTPQTDARELAVSIQNEDSCCAIYVKIDGKEYEGGLVDTEFARELERENAELRTDGQRWQNEHLRLLAENAELLAANAELINVCAELSATADELRAENAELRREKARLDWLDADGEVCDDYRGHYWREWLVSTINTPLKPDASVRAAIDAAMEAGK